MVNLTPCISIESFTIAYIHPIVTAVYHCLALKNVICFHRLYILFRIPVTVPTGLAEFPHEIFLTPEPWTHSLFLDIVQYSEIPRGGHFAAFEEPELFADDVIKFVEKVEKRIAAKKAEDTTEHKSE